MKHNCIVASVDKMCSIEIEDASLCVTNTIWDTKSQLNMDKLTLENVDILINSLMDYRADRWSKQCLV